MHYRQLDDTTNEIRLLTILPSASELSISEPVCCTLAHFSLNERAENDSTSAGGRYAALSYTWGKCDRSCDIFVNGDPIRVTPNLEAALRLLRTKSFVREGCKLWVDSLCIDQDNVVERNHEVKRIKAIYQESSEVIVWLGEEQDESFKAMAFLKRMSGCWKDGGEEKLRIRLREVAPLMQGNGLWKSLTALMKRPYWGRVWIVQETVVAKENLRVLCGNDEVRWRDLHEVLYYFNAPRRDGITAVIDEELGPLSAAVQELKQDRWYWLWDITNNLEGLRKAESGLMPRDQLWLMSYGRARSCQDPRDKVYGLLGLMQGSILSQIEPDYDKAVSDVYLDFARTWIRTHGLEILSQCNMYVDHIEKDTPSWAPDWHNDFRALYGSSEPKYHASEGSTPGARFSVDGKLCTCDGVVVDVVDGFSRPYSGSNAEDGTSVVQPINKGRSFYADRQAIQDALWRSLVGDRDLSGERASYKYATLLSIDLQNPIQSSHIISFLSLNSDFVVLGDSLSSYFNQRPSAVRYGSQAVDDALARAERFMFTRRIITTANGLIGAASPEVQKGDVVCVLCGCSCPLLLRPRGTSFKIVDPCYVHGIMDGEAMDWVRDGDARLREIAIC